MHIRLTLAAATILCADALAQPAYRMVQLPQLPMPADAAHIYGGLQGRGMFVGWQTNDGSSAQFIAEPTGFRAVPGVPGLQRTWAQRGNSFNDFAGSGDFNGNHRGVVWRNGVPQLTSEWTGTESGFSDVNEQRVFAGALINQDGSLQAATATFDGTFTLLPSPANALTTYATAINDAGVVVGQAYTTDGPTAVRWNNGAVEQMVVSPEWQENAMAIHGHVINASGLSVFSLYSQDPSVSGAYLWTNAGAQRIVAGTLAIPLGISDTGDIAFFGIDQSLWSAGQTYAPADLLIDGQTGRDFMINDIAADGTLLAQFWSPETGSSFALLEVVPSPGGATFCAIAAVALTRRRRT